MTTSLNDKPVTVINGFERTRRPVGQMGRPRRSDAAKEVLKGIGLRLRWVREAMGHSQTEVAMLLCIHQTTWSLYERGERMPDHFEITRIAAKLQLDLNYILTGDLTGLPREVAIRIAAAHPELVAPRSMGPRTDKGPA